MIRSLILVLFGGTLLMLAIKRLRVYKLKERYTLLFLLLGLPFLVLAIWPALIEKISNALGINYQTVMLLAVSVFFILTVFELLTIVSVQDRKISTLAQMVAILTEKQKSLDRQLQQQRQQEQPEISAPLPAAPERPAVTVTLPARTPPARPERAPVRVQG
ncbi:MAG TPA: DUF2304 domain-containing protein [Tepidisphaeraceae bacterium]|jgi:hypothetical protein